MRYSGEVLQMRYCVPSAHASIARWDGPAKDDVESLQEVVGEINGEIEKARGILLETRCGVSRTINVVR